MYPNAILFGLTLYDLCIFCGIIVAVFVFRSFFVKLTKDFTSFRAYLIMLSVAVLFGFLGAVISQGLFSFAKSGELRLFSSGMNFLGGAVVGAAVFFIEYAIIIRLKLFSAMRDSLKKSLKYAINCGICVIPLAHAFGRIGCLTAGCCHGKATSSFVGVLMWSSELNAYVAYVPIQLFEACFLIALFAALSLLLFKRGKYVLPSYLVFYGAWRFVIEFFRGDERGAFLFGIFSPAQTISLAMLILGIVLFFIIHRKTANEVISVQA